MYGVRAAGDAPDFLDRVSAFTGGRILKIAAAYRSYAFGDHATQKRRLEELKALAVYRKGKSLSGNSSWGSTFRERRRSTGFMRSRRS